MFFLTYTPATAAENDPDSPPSVQFTIKAYTLTGNSKITTEQLQKIIQPYTGESKSFDTIELAVTAIEKAYKKAGYDAVRVLIPKQEIENDIVRLEVVEATIGRILVEGNKNFNADNSRRSLPSLKEGAVPDVTNLGMNLRLANESFSKQTQVTFRQGTDPRSMDAVASVADNKPLYTAVTLDNTGTDPTGEWRLGFALLHNNFFNRDHTFTAQFVTSPGHWSDVKIFGLGYSIPLYSLGGTIDLSASHSSVNSGQVSTTSGNYNISGSGDNFGIHYTQLLPRWGEWDQRLGVGIDDKFFHSSVTTKTSSSSQVPDVEVHPVFLSYTGKIKTPQRELGVTISGFHNVPMGNQGDQRAINQSRKNASATYNLLKIDSNLTQIFQNGGKIHCELNAQLTGDALVAGEQFGLGGANSVRGFDEREVADDYGYRASFELQTPQHTVVSKLGGLKLNGLVFADMGDTYRNEPQPSEETHHHISSAGIGMRGSMGDHISFRLDVGSVISGLSTRSDGEIKAHTSITFLY